MMIDFSNCIVITIFKFNFILFNIVSFAEFACHSPCFLGEDKRIVVYNF